MPREWCISRPYNPKACSVCAVAILSLLQHPCLTGLEPKDLAVLQRLSNLLNLSSKHCKTMTWADPGLPLMLNFGHPPLVSPSPSLQSLLREPVQPELTFTGFPPSTVVGTGNMPPSHAAPSVLVPSSGSLFPPQKKKSWQWHHHKKILAAPPPAQQPDLGALDESHPFLAPHQRHLHISESSSTIHRS